MGLDYKAAGVDREKADQWIEDLKPKIRSTFRPEVESDVGDFGAFFRAPTHYREPLWVATTDGVGTKLLIAEEMNFFRGLGQDLVGMNVNDLLCCRAEPLIFLDYVATGKIEAKSMNEFMEGLTDACRESSCSLVGGETAEMPGFYAPGRFDVAGFAVGVLEKSKRFNKSHVQVGDIVMGFKSSGFHSNGYSLVRKVIQKQGWALDKVMEGRGLGEQLLAPTELYVRSALKLFQKANLKAVSHITGGGLIENLPRGFDEKLQSVELSRSKIPVPALMQKFVEAAGMEEVEAFSTWNMGVGFCCIVSPDEKKLVEAEGGFEIGRVIPRGKAPVYFS